jgi:hypothetical protein
MAGIFVLAALLWVTEALPLFATSTRRIENPKLANRRKTFRSRQHHRRGGSVQQQPADTVIWIR